MGPTVQIVSDPPALAREAARILASIATSAVAASGRFTVVLSGGSTPKALYSLLVNDADLRAGVPWDRTWFFFGDERHVPPTDADSNYRMAHEAMLSSAPVRASQVLRIKGELERAAEAAAEYERDLRRFFDEPALRYPRFDLVLLGLGPDGHTASLFPGTSALSERSRWVTSSWVPKLQTDRITLTSPLLNEAGFVMFMVSGKEKADAVKATLEGPHDPERVPAQLIRPRAGTLLWLVDEAAASQLDRRSSRGPPVSTSGRTP